MRIALTSMLAVLPLVGATDSLPGQALGLVGGLTASSIEGDTPARLKWGRKTNLLLGLVGQLPVTGGVHLVVQPTLTRRGSTLQAEVKGQRQRMDSGSVSLDYVTLPVLVKVTAAHNRTFVTSGLELGILTGATLREGTAEIDVKDRLERFDVAVDFGFGGVVVPGRPRITLELRYSQSFFNLGNSTTTEEALPVCVHGP